MIDTEDTQHFHFSYNPALVSDEALRRVEHEAEAAYARVQRFFPEVRTERRIDVRLDVEFAGATAYAMPGGGERGRDLIGIRYADLDVLGLPVSFLFPHEITHLFAARWARAEAPATRSMMSGGVVGEGLADYVAGGLDGLGLADWWGKLFQQQRLWEDPMARFVRGDDTAAGLNRSVLALRVAHYDEPALLIKYLIDRYGRDAFRRFYIDYNTVLGAAYRNSRRGGPAFDPARVEAVFQRDLGAPPAPIFASWQSRINGSQVPPEEGRRVLLAHEIYAGVQEFEQASHAHPPSGPLSGRIHDAFRQANSALWANDLDAAGRHLQDARRLAGLRAGLAAPPPAATAPDRSPGAPQGELAAERPGECRVHCRRAAASSFARGRPPRGAGGSSQRPAGRRP